MLTAIDRTADAAYAHCADCGADRAIDLRAVVLGTDADPNVIDAGKCACGTHLFMNRPWDAASHPSANRLCVLAVAEHLQAAGRTHPAHAAFFATCGSPPNAPDVKALPAGRVEAAALRPASGG